jgi:hypothetical protein
MKERNPMPGSERELAPAEEFVVQILLPFLRRCRSCASPSPENVAALYWGFQHGRGSAIPLPDVAAQLRIVVERFEHEEKPAGRVGVVDVIEALRLVEEALPQVALTFGSCELAVPAPRGISL